MTAAAVAYGAPPSQNRSPGGAACTRQSTSSPARTSRSPNRSPPKRDDRSLVTPRERNRLRIVAALRSYGSASRGELAHTTGLSRSTVSSLVADLQARGLVADAPSHRRQPARTGRGRPPELLRLHADAGAALALRVGKRGLDVAVADLSSTILSERRVALQPGSDIATAVETAAEAVAAALAEAGVERGKLRGAALVAPAASDTSAWADDNAGAALSSRLGIPVRIENEANLGALGELAFGAATGRSDVVYVNLSARIGAGIVIGGRLHRGATGAAGELGHIEVRPTARCAAAGTAAASTRSPPSRPSSTCSGRCTGPTWPWAARSTWSRAATPAPGGSSPTRAGPWAACSPASATRSTRRRSSSAVS